MKLPHEFTSPVKIGAGSFASVYRVDQKNLQRNVALKIIPSGSRNRNSIVNEAHLLAMVTPSCAPHIYDIRQSRSSVIIVMEWIFGIPLEQLLEQHLSPGEKRSLANDIIRGCAQLHRNNIVHRDLKPSNIIVSPERGIVFVDFGFSCSTGFSPEKSAGTLRGTPTYMAPELWRSDEPVDLKKVDLYALGNILQHILGDDLPAVAARCMCNDPHARPADAAELADEWDMVPYAADRDTLNEHVARASAEHTSRLLYRGAADLCTRKRHAEAYPLLTESIRLWPDNNEALLLLQNEFSTPIVTQLRRQRLVRFAAGSLFFIMIAGAYFIGRQSIREPVYPEDTFMFTSTDEHPLLTLPPAAATAKPVAVSFTLHHGLAGTDDFPGTLTVMVADGHGAVVIDGQTSPHQTGTTFQIDLPAGIHRIEWYDSTSHRRFGETIDLVPFSRKTISLTRFTHDQ